MKLASKLALLFVSVCAVSFLSASSCASVEAEKQQQMAELTEYDTFNTQFGPEMSIIMFTDGINEAENADGEQFGIPRIKEGFMQSCLAHASPREAVAKLMDDVDRFSPANGEQDDRTVVVISPLI